MSKLELRCLWLSAIAALVVAGIPGASLASALTVPDDQPTIQAALNAAPDTVFIRAGQYAESPLVSGAVAVITIPSLQGDQTRIRSLTLRPAFASGNAVFLFDHLVVAGQVTIDNSALSAHITFSSCELDNGIADVSQYVDTIAMHLRHCTIQGHCQLYIIDSAQLDTCTVAGSIVTGGGMPHVSVVGCIFSGNGVGYAIYVQYADTVVLDGNTITNYVFGLTADVDTGAQLINNRVEDCSYKGFYLQHQGIDVRNNVMRRCGIGMDLSTSGGVQVTGNTVEACSGQGIIVSSPGDGRIANNVVSGCGGAGVEVKGDLSGLFSVAGNTIVGNQGAGIEWEIGSNLFGYAEVLSNICYSNAGYGVNWVSDVVNRVACNDLFENQPADLTGRAPSPEDISVRPQFCDASGGDFHLLAGSPLADWSGCGQVGALGVGCGLTATMVTRFSAEREGDGVRILWEVVEGTGSNIWLERSEVALDGPWVRPITTQSQQGDATLEYDRTAVSDREYWYRLVEQDGQAQVVIGPRLAVPALESVEFTIRSLGPNPSSGLVRIEFGVRTTANIEIDVFDVQGRVVASPAHGVWPAGKHAVEWSGLAGGSSAAAGMYLVRYRYPGGEDKRRLVRVL